MAKEEIQLEESYLLLEFFENVKRALVYLQTDEVEFEVRPKRTAKFLKYRFFYRNDEGEHVEELITHVLNMGNETMSKTELENFNKVVAVIEKEKASLKPINKETKIEDFLRQFSKVHEVVYINKELNKELPVNESNEEQRKRLKL